MLPEKYSQSAFTAFCTTHTPFHFVACEIKCKAGPTAVEFGVPKLGNCLKMYTCAQASVQFVHSMCTNLDTPFALKLLLGHPLYTGAVYMLAHRLGHMCTFPSSFQAWALQLLQQ